MRRRHAFPLQNLTYRVGPVRRQVECAVIASRRHEARGGVADDGDAQRRRLERNGQLLDQPAGALVGLLGAVGEHRAAILVDDFQIEALLGFLEHDVFRDLGQFRHVLQRLPQ